MAFAPAGGWAKSDESSEDTLGFFTTMHDHLKAAAPHAEAIVATTEGRRSAAQFIATHFEHIPAELLAHQILGAASYDAVPLIEYAIREGYSLEAERITCPVRIVWGTDDKLLSWPSTAARFLNDWLPHADWVELEGIGHCPQLDIPLEAAQLILGFTAANGFSAIDLHRQSRVRVPSPVSSRLSQQIARSESPGTNRSARTPRSGTGLADQRQQPERAGLPDLALAPAERARRARLAEPDPFGVPASQTPVGPRRVADGHPVRAVGDDHRMSGVPLTHTMIVDPKSLAA